MPSPAELAEGAFPEAGAQVELLHQFFERQAQRTPDLEAAVCGSQRLTYRQLDILSSQLAAQLTAAGVGRGACVAFLLERGLQVYIALLAILKSGAAYVPLDPDYPADRLSFILKDCAAAVLLTSPELSQKCRDYSGRIIKIDSLDMESRSASSSIEPPHPSTLPEDLCYIIYTSGTTGRPKGVQIEHRSACHLVHTERDLFKVQPGDRVFQGFSIAFDASVEEIWLGFATGATLVVATREMLRSGPSLAGLLADAGVTVLSCVPTLLAMIEQDIPCLRLLILGGEVCPPELVRRWWKPDRRVVNTYGPTEATVVATYADCRPDQPVTIGKPLAGYITLVLDEQLRIVPTGEPGELVLGGVGLARGYLNRPELTNEKFVFRKFEGVPIERFYRTGDLVRCTGSGDLEFLGRIDSQVKIRGFRVELSEIESVLMECAGVKAAAAALKNDNLGVSTLMAYVVYQTGVAPDTQALREILKKRLPAFMVPGAVKVMTSLPMLSSGKVDRTALPAPTAEMVESEKEIILPRTDLEKQLTIAWSKLFSLPRVSVADDFFLDLGGHSVLAARMVSELRRLPEFEALSMADVYRHTTIRELAQKFGTAPSRRDALPEELIEKCADAPSATSLPFGGRGAQDRSKASPGVQFLRHFLCGTAQLLSLVFVLSFFALQWLAPYLTYTVLVEEEYDFTTSILFAFASLVLLYPIMLLVAVVLKWTIIGRYKPGEYPLWGWYYFRFWLVTAIESTVPTSYLSGTPLFSVYLRLMGARIGRNVFLQSDNFAVYDLLSIGDGASVNADATLLGYSVSDGLLKIGSITVGKGCFVGARAALAENTRMEDGSALEDLSVLPSGQTIGSGETWLGSPANASIHWKGQGKSKETTGSDLSQAPTKTIFIILHAAGLLIFPVLVVAALFPGIALMNRLNYLDPYYWYLLLSPLVAVSFVALLCLEIVALKWLLLGRIRPGKHRLDSWYYVRKWFVDKTMELSLDVVGPLYASVYLSPWYKLLGAKLGYGAEISTASFISPDLLSIGAESFIADNVSLGAPRVRNGMVSIGPNAIGRRAFIGNSALLPAGTAIGDDVLIGCLSAPPENPSDALRKDSAWLGSPAMFLPQRLKETGFGAEATYNPSVKLRILRATIEFVRVISPSTGFIILTSLLFSALLLLHDSFTLAQTLLFFPVLYLGCGLAAAGFTILAKWILVGRYRPGEKPLWSSFVWRNELINALHEHLAGPFLVGALSGTPFLAWYLRLLGARIGRRVYIETSDFSEFDLVRIGDEAALNAECTIQTHLFEDRVMKMSRLEIGARCSVGANALVLYDTQMEPGSRLGPLSLLMKGEVLPANTSWMGIPARISSAK